MSLFLSLLFAICLFTGFMAYFDNRLIRNRYYYLLLFFIIFCYALLVANRPSYLLDTKSYYTIYESISIDSLSDFSLVTREYKTGVEYGFILILLPFKLLNLDIKIVFFTFAVLEFIVFFISINCIFKTRNLLPEGINYYFLVLVFIVLFGLYYQCIAFRSGISLALSFSVLALIINKKYIFSMILLLIMFSIHRTSLVALIPIFIYFSNIKFSKSLYFVTCTIISLLLILNYGSGYIYKFSNYIFTFIFDRLSIDYRGYFNESVSTMGLATIDIYYIVNTYITIAFSKYKYNNNAQNMNLSLATLLCVYLTFYVSGAKRIFDFFAIYYILIFYDIFTRKGGFQKIITLAILGIYMILMIRIYIYY